MKSGVVVVAGVLCVRGKLLVAGRRNPGKKLFWEFPGGKVEKGETLSSALRRELREELGIKVRVGRCLGREPFSSPRCKGEVVFLSVTRCGGRLRKNDREEVKWVKRGRLSLLSLLPADRRFVRKLKSLTCCEVTGPS